MVYGQEILYAIRALRRTKGFFCITVGILALGIAANAIVFSVMNAAILKPLPYPNAEQLVVVNPYASGKLTSQEVSARTFFLLQDQIHSFDSLVAMSHLAIGFNLGGPGKPEYVKGFRVSGDFFRTLGVYPALGRGFITQGEEAGDLHSVVISNSLWVRLFDSAPYVIGQEVHVDGEPFTVVGVMPAGFRSYPDADLWLPLQLSPGMQDAGNQYLVIGRLKNGLTIEAAQRELDHSIEVTSSIALHSQTDQVRLIANSLHSFMYSSVRKSIILLLGAVLFVLLIACTNLAVLLTVRAAARIREVAIRLALGSTKARLVRMFLLESLLISIAGGITGIVLAKEALPFVLLLAPADMWFLHSVNVDGRVILFTAALTLLTVFIFGLAPTLALSHANLNELLRQTTSNSTHGSRHARLGRLLAVAQAALTIVLITGAGLLLRSFSSLQSVAPGFNPQHLWALQLSLASDRYKTTLPAAQLLQELCEKIKVQPGVEAVASISGLPFEPGLNLTLQQADHQEKTVYAQYRIVSPEYFHAMEISMIDGRPFTVSDTNGTLPVVIINQTLAKQWWPEERSLGHYVAVDNTLKGVFPDAARLVVGVVSDVHEFDLSAPPSPTVFVPVNQVPDTVTAFTNRVFPTSVVLRVANTSPPLDRIRNLLSAQDPDLPVASVRPLTDVLSRSLARERFYTSLITGFGLFAIALTALGLYGVLSYQIVLRTREIAVRLALGTSRFDVAMLAVKQGAGLVLSGSLLGALAVPFEMKMLSTMLYNVHRATPLVVISAIFALTAVAALSSLVSAARAASIEPAMTLGFE